MFIVRWPEHPAATPLHLQDLMSHTNGMSLADEIESELALCREIFERLPSEMLAWKPHEKSASTGELAMHIADMVEWIGLATTTQELDYATREHVRHEPSSTEDVLRYFDARAAGVAAAVRTLNAQALQDNWTVRHGQRLFFARSKEHVIRVDCLNHLIHHRGQLTIYCRLRDVALPGVYGPDDDE